MMTSREFYAYFDNLQVALKYDAYQSYWYDKDGDDQTSNYYIGQMTANLNTMNWI